MGISNINRSPLDGVVNAIESMRAGKRKADQKIKNIKGAPRRKVSEIKSKVVGITPSKCDTLGHKGKRGFGKMCQRGCGSQLL